MIKKPAAIIFGVLAILGGTWHLLDSGFCFSQMRYVSDRELLVAAIQKNSPDMRINGSDASSAIDFLKNNPTCCSVDRHPPRRTLFDVCLGFNYAEVEINYEKKKPVSASEPFYQAFISIDSCGTNPHYERGMSHATKRAAEVATLV